MHKFCASCTIFALERQNSRKLFHSLMSGKYNRLIRQVSASYAHVECVSLFLRYLGNRLTHAERAQRATCPISLFPRHPGNETIYKIRFLMLKSKNCIKAQNLRLRWCCLFDITEKNLEIIKVLLTKISLFLQ